MKTSVLVLKSTLVLGLCLGPGCATHHDVRVQDPAYAAPAGQLIPVNSPEIVREPAAPVQPPSTNPAVIGPSTAASVLVTEAPPPPHIEVVRQPPGPNYVWIPGYWEWKDRWTWRNGHWVVEPHPNAAWVPGRWVRRDTGWIWVRGYWR